MANCFFCKNTAEVHTQGIRRYWHCKGCGYFYITESASIKIHDNRNWIDKNKVACFLFYDNIINSELRESSPIYIHPSDGGFVADNQGGKPRIATEVDIENWYPKTFAEKIDKILLLLSRKSKFEGHKVSFSHREIKSLFFQQAVVNITQEKTAEEQKEITRIQGENETNEEFILKFLRDSGLVICEKTAEIISNGEKTYRINFTITPKGYERIYELQRTQAGNKKAFIAMSFAPEYTSIMEAIKTAVRESGYMPNPILDKPHNNWIMAEILFEIRDSKFVIADLTGHNNGAYYEAGFAEALGKQVILTCRKSDFEKRHFDISQKFVVVYETETELIEKLKAQIKGTVGVAR